MKANLNIFLTVHVCVIGKPNILPENTEKRDICGHLLLNGQQKFRFTRKFYRGARISALMTCFTRLALSPTIETNEIIVSMRTNIQAKNVNTHVAWCFAFFNVDCFNIVNQPNLLLWTVSINCEGLMENKWYFYEFHITKPYPMSKNQSSFILMGYVAGM